MIELLQQLSAAEIVGLTIIGEARGESISGQVAVGNVIKNRYHSHSKYHSFHDVCLEKLQFSCWNENDPNYPILIELAQKLHNGQFISDPYLRQCMFVATGIVDDDLLDNTHGAMNYLTKSLFDSKTVKWADNAKNINTIGNQIFFNA